MQSPRGISGPYLKGLGLTLNRQDFITPIGVMPHGTGVWHTTSRITLKSNPPGNFVLGKSSRDPTFLLGLVLITGRDQSWNPRRICVLILHQIQVSFLDMLCNQGSFGEMNFLWHHWRIFWRKISMNLFKLFASINLLYLMDHLFTLWKVDIRPLGKICMKVSASKHHQTRRRWTLRRSKTWCLSEESGQARACGGWRGIWAIDAGSWTWLWWYWSH